MGEANLDNITNYPAIPATSSSCIQERLVIIRAKGNKQRKKKNKVSEDLDDNRGPKIKEFVREDVYLMDNKNRSRVQANLLANSLTARLRKNLPDDVDFDSMKNLRRESLKDFKHLDNLNKQYTNEMNLESSRLDKETFRLLKRHQQMKKQSENQRRNQDKLESLLRSRSGMSSASLFPRLMDSEASDVSPRREPSPERFPEFANVDKDDLSRVKVFKYHGVFQPQNKYNISRIEPLNLPPKVKRTPPKDQTETPLQESLRLADSETPTDLPTKSRMSKKGLRVSWSRQSRFYEKSEGYSETDSQAPSRAETHGSHPDTCAETRTSNNERDEKVITSTSMRSFKSIQSVRSDSFLLRKNPGRSKIVTIGLNWKLPPGSKVSPKPPKAPSQGLVSHNLKPMTKAMSQEGQTTNKLRWQVQKAPSISTYQMYNSWLGKLEMLRGNNCSIDSNIQDIPKRTHLSVMSQPVR